MNTTLESTGQQLVRSSLEVYEFLLDLNNHQHLMPPQATNWESSEDHYQFTIPNTATIRVHRSANFPSSLIQLTPQGEKIPFPFELNWHLRENHGITEVKLEFRADINAFLKMIVSNPLQNLLHHQTKALCTHLG